MGVGLQANHRGHIIVDGGGRIIIAITTSDIILMAKKGDIIRYGVIDGDLDCRFNWLLVKVVNKDY